MEHVKTYLAELIRKSVQEYQARPDVATEYGEPLIGVADAMDSYIQNLPHVIDRGHDLPQDVLPGAKTILAYYAPFTKSIARANENGERLASEVWARAYEETNAMFGLINERIIAAVEQFGGRAAVSPQASTFSQEKLISGWSHRHIAYAAGLGTFGINNMLLTRKGCCGRFSTVITDLALETDHHMEEDLCLYRKNGACGACVQHCPAGALTKEGYDRFRCYALCRENAEIYTMFGSSYTNEDGTGANSIGSEVCGKCVTGVPCTFWTR